MSMTVNLTNLFSDDSGNFYLNLSEKGKFSVSSSIVQQYYKEINNCFHTVESTFSYCRNADGSVYSASYSDELIISQRLQFELIGLTVQLLSRHFLPDLDRLIESDPDTDEADKKLIKYAYTSLISKIQMLEKMYGRPCFGFKKEEQKDE